MDEKQNQIPIFFATDDNYIPFLCVALQSLIDNATNENQYIIKILYVDIKEENKKKILKYNSNNVNIEFVDLSYYIEKVKDQLFTRDYYTNTTYFRLFISDLYPQYNKVLYLDSDIVVLKDVAELYRVDIEGKLIAAAPEDVIQNNKVFQEYVEKVVGMASYKQYFNAGVVLMNLDELRKFKFQEKFLYLLKTVKFAVIQDEDYLNRLCKGRVRLLDTIWNREPIPVNKGKNDDIKIIHYAYVYKPWHSDNVLYQEYFWEYAKKTPYYNEILKIKETFTEEARFKELEADKNLRILAQKEADCVGDDRMYRGIRPEVFEKSKDRLIVLDRIEKFEREGTFDIDAEDDPPTLPLMPEDIDYLRVKYKNKIKRSVANKIGEKFLDELIRNEKLIIKEITGIETLNSLSSTGAILTCNHFNPFDCFAVEQTFRESNLKKNRKRLYKVIREGNYTNFPGLYGFFFKNCDTLPLSSISETMKMFINSVDTILKKGDYILIYPEQSLWWNYKKPKPLKDGAFHLAVRNNVPVLPLFITMKETDKIGEDGFPIMEYYIHIEKPIFPDKNLSNKENIKSMKKKNFEVWKNIYEDFYEIPLEYTTENKEVFNG